MPKKVQEKKLKLVCKCGDCAHWEIILEVGSHGYANGQMLKCVSCGDTMKCDFNVGPHEGLHYEKV